MEISMRILVAVTDYPSPESVALMYVHTRNKIYAENGFEVSVLNFSASKGYVFEGIRVFSLSEVQQSDESYDLLVCHAANIRNHYRFLKRAHHRFAHIVFFFHGHEVLRINRCYPDPYPYMGGNSFFYRMFWACYDTLKLFLWRKTLPKLAGKSRFIFVSRDFFGEFKRYTKLNEEKLSFHTEIIHNSVGRIFEQQCYDPSGPKEYDFISIRPYMDQTKYGVDLVSSLARANPDLKFLVVGKGRFFQENPPPENLDWHDGTLFPEQIPQWFCRARGFLNPTRADTQGVMTCEAATFGIPTITSDLPICHEICDSFSNVAFIDNKNTQIDLRPILEELERRPFEKSERYFIKNTVLREVELFRSLAEEK